jgi:hypothetical protein
MHVTTHSGSRVTRRRRAVPYSVVFGLTATLACVVQGAFLFFVLQQAGLLDAIRLLELQSGLRAIAVLVALGFLIDLFGLRQRPFAWIDAISLRVLRRMLVVQAVIIIGFAAVGWFHAPQALLAGFALFKLLTDVGSQVPEYHPREAPRWMVRWLGAGFADHWRRERHQEDALAAAQEEPYAGVPMPPARATLEVTRT